MKRLILAALLLAAAAPAEARPVVVELFTSEACSSCPPAEKLLGELAGYPNVLALAFHVTYWDGPAWTDKFSLTAATDRQTNYALLQHSQNVYTPEAVVDGATSMVGSNRGQLLAAITAAGASQATPVTVSVSGSQMVTVKIGAGNPTPATIWLFGYDAQHTTQIGGGENGGATIHEVDVVRSITSLGGWTGQATTSTMSKPDGEHMAVLLQAADGTVLGAGAD